MGGLSQRGVRWSVESRRLSPGSSVFLIYVNDMVRTCRGLELVQCADDRNMFAGRGRTPLSFLGG